MFVIFFCSFSERSKLLCSSASIRLPLRASLSHKIKKPWSPMPIVPLSPDSKTFPQHVCDKHSQWKRGRPDQFPLALPQLNHPLPYMAAFMYFISSLISTQHSLIPPRHFLQINFPYPFSLIAPTSTIFPMLEAWFMTHEMWFLCTVPRRVFQMDYDQIYIRGILITLYLVTIILYIRCNIIPSIHLAPFLLSKVNLLSVFFKLILFGGTKFGVNGEDWGAY